MLGITRRAAVLGPAADGHLARINFSFRGASATEQAQLIDGMQRADALTVFPSYEDRLDHTTNISLPGYL